MARRSVMLAAVVCVLTGAMVGPTRSQMRGGSAGGGAGLPPFGPGVGRSASSSGRSEVTDATRELSIKEALRASDAEWQVIRPRLERVKTLQRHACVTIATSGGISGGMRQQGQSQTPLPPGVRGGAGAGAPRSSNASRTWMTWRWNKSWGEAANRADEKACDRLFTVLEHGGSAVEIEHTAADLREAGQKAAEAVAEAQAQLRQALSCRQEAVLILLGYLD